MPLYMWKISRSPFLLTAKCLPRVKHFGSLLDDFHDTAVLKIHWMVNYIAELEKKNLKSPIGPK